jgi:hypothetical protein
VSLDGTIPVTPVNVADVADVADVAPYLGNLAQMLKN